MSARCTAAMALIQLLLQLPLQLGGVAEAVPVGFYYNYAAKRHGAAEPCPVSFYCPGDGRAYVCPPGRCCSSLRLSTLFGDGDCLSGYFCRAGSKNCTANACGSSSVYCPRGSSGPFTADEGSFTVRSSAIDDRDRQWHRTASSNALPLSQFGAIRPRQPRRAPELTAAVFDDSTLRDSQLPCDMGHYCTSGVRFPCPAGTFGSTSELKNASCSGLCSAGHWCGAGSVSGSANVCGGPGVFCPVGSAQPTPVAAGYYSLPAFDPAMRIALMHMKEDAVEQRSNSTRFRFGLRESTADRDNVHMRTGDGWDYVRVGAWTGLESKLLTPPSLITTRAASTSSAQNACPPGTYCMEGVAALCPAGTFGATFGLVNSLCSGSCTSGFYCIAGSTLAAPPHATCANASYYCPAASGQRTLVSDGYYTMGGRTLANGGRTDHTMMMQCDQYPGSAGFSQAPALDRDDPYPYTQSSFDRSTPVATVRWLNRAAGELDDEPTTKAVVRFHDPEPLYRRCAGGAELGDEDTRSGQRPCPQGAYCEKGWVIHCPPGTASNATRASNASACQPCAPGTFCPGFGNTVPVPCGDASVYCPGFGNTQPISVIPGYVSIAHKRVQRCALGHYCNGGVATPCPPGYWGGSTGLTTLFCSGQCAAGYFCGAGSVSPIATACSAGLAPADINAVYCPPGSSAPLNVSLGFYATGGFSHVYNEPHNTTHSSQARCGPGYWCERGVVRQCPAGTFGNVSGLYNGTCSGSCPAGYFCPPGSVNSETYPCGSLFVALIDVLGALSPPQLPLPPPPAANDSTYAPAPPVATDVRNPAGPMMSTLAGVTYDYRRLYALYAQLAGGGTVEGGPGGTGVSGAVLVSAPLSAAEYAYAPVVEAAAQVIGNTSYASSSLLPVSYLQDPNNSNASATSDNSDILIVGQANVTAASGARDANTVVLLIRHGAAAADSNATNTTQHVGFFPNASALRAALAGSGIASSILLDAITGDSVLALAVRVSVAWEAGVRLRLPPVTIPIESFAANHRLLVMGGPGAMYCPAGSGWPLPVPSGYVSTTSGAAVEVDDTIGTNMTRDGIRLAVAGTYAVAGVSHPCALGTFGRREGLSSRECDGWCPQGHACASGTSIPVQCSVYTYAPPGSPACMPCPGLESKYTAANSTYTASNDGISAVDAGVCRSSRNCCDLYES